MGGKASINGIKLGSDFRKKYIISPATAMAIPEAAMVKIFNLTESSTVNLILKSRPNESNCQ